MCLGIPGKIVAVVDDVAVVDFWGVEKPVRLDTLEQHVVPGDYVLDHAGFAVRVIPPDQVNDTLMQYEAIFAEAGEDPVVADVVAELEMTPDLDLEPA